MSLASMKSLLKRLGDPQLGRHTAHVTGSKGKGSTSHMLASILTQGGLTTSLFISPHLNSYTEQLKISRNGTAHAQQNFDPQYCDELEFGLFEISPNEFVDGINAIRTAVEAEHDSNSGPVSTFGALCALYFHLSNKHHVTWQIVEVGMGGTHDATNVFDQKELVIITPISLEHTAILGNTIAEIAANKAGIITPGCITVLARQKDPAVKKVIAKRCAEVGSKLIDVTEHYEVEHVGISVDGQEFLLCGPRGKRHLQIKMLGSHQIDNAITAVTAADALLEFGIKIDDISIARGLAKVKIPGRFEILSQQPTIVMDGAHNGESAAALRHTLDELFPDKKRIFILGVNADKDVKTIASNLFGDLPVRKTHEFLTDLVNGTQPPAAATEVRKTDKNLTVIATQSKNLRAMLTTEIINACQAVQANCIKSQSVEEAMKIAMSLAKPEDLICVTGSLYVVAEARAAMGMATE